MKKLFFLILLLGAFFGAQVVYFQNFVKTEKVLDFDQITNSIVSIESQPNNPNQRFGSGVIISSDGYIITAFHLLSGSLSSIKIDDELYTANLIGFDEYADLARSAYSSKPIKLAVYNSSSILIELKDPESK